jgi:transcriptional accessory protein Tex/SPT6
VQFVDTFKWLLVNTKSDLNKNRHDEDIKRLSKKLLEYKVDFVSVGAQSMEAKKLGKILIGVCSNVENNKIDGMTMVDREGHPIWAGFCPMIVPRAYAASKAALKAHPTANQWQKQAISCGRMKQDPLAESLQIWSDNVKEAIISGDTSSCAANIFQLHK